MSSGLKWYRKPCRPQDKKQKVKEAPQLVADRQYWSQNFSFKVKMQVHSFLENLCVSLAEMIKRFIASHIVNPKTTLIVCGKIYLQIS